MSHNDYLPEPPMRVGLPADVARPDTIIGNFTARQVAIFAATGMVLWLAWAATQATVPMPVFFAVAAPVALFGFALAMLKRDGIGLDTWLVAAMRHQRRPKTLVPADGQITPAPAWVAMGGKTGLPAPLRLPAQGIHDGLINLGPDGHAALVDCSTVNLHLRSTGEQHTLVAGFARWLNALDAPAQILVRSRRVDLAPMADAITTGAASLRDAQLEAAARRHAVFLHQLSAGRELLHRQVTVVVRDKRSPVHAQHRALQAAQALQSCDISTRVLDSAAVGAVLAECVNAGHPVWAPESGDGVTRGRSSQ